MKRRLAFIVAAAVTLLLSQSGVMAAGISDSVLKTIFPPESKVVDNKALIVPGQGNWGHEILVTIPYKEKISNAELEYSVQFYFRRQILDHCREQSEALVEQRLAQFANEAYTFWGGTPLEFDEAGSSSERIPPDGAISTEMIDPPQKAEVAGGIVWYQRSEIKLKGREQVLYRCHYVARKGDFVATLDVEGLPDSKARADEWFRKLIAACNVVE